MPAASLPAASAVPPSPSVDLRFDRAAAEARLAAHLASLPAVLEVPAAALASGMQGPPVQLDPRVAEQLASSDTEYAEVFAAALVAFRGSASSALAASAAFALAFAAC